MIDDPLGLSQGVGDGQPAPVPRWEDVDEGTEDLERLPVAPPLLGLAEGLLQHLDGLVVAAVGGAGEVERRFPQVPDDEERPAHLAMEGEAQGGPDVLVDGFLDDRVADLIGHPVQPLVLDHEPGVGQPADDGRQFVQGTAAEAHQVAQHDRATGHGHHLEHRLGLVVEETHPDPDPVGQFLGQEPQAGAGHTALVAQGPQQATRIQRVAPGALDHPVEDVLGHHPAQHVLGQLPDRTFSERPDLEALEGILLLEVEEYPDRQRLIGQFPRVRRRHH